MLESLWDIIVRDVKLAKNFPLDEVKQLPQQETYASSSDRLHQPSRKFSSGRRTGVLAKITANQDSSFANVFVNKDTGQFSILCINSIQIFWSAEFNWAVLASLESFVSSIMSSQSSIREHGHMSTSLKAYTWLPQIWWGMMIVYIWSLGIWHMTKEFWIKGKIVH